MTQKVKVRSLGVWTLVLVIVLVLTSLGNSVGSVRADEIPPTADGETSTEYLTVNTITAMDGNLLTETIIHGPSLPPLGYEAETASVDPQSMMAIQKLTVPAFSWVFGCSAVSGAMIAGFYDRNDYPNMYAGPTDGGVMPLTDTSWPNWSDGFDTYPNNPLIASHKGVDGRAAALKGSIDDYWIKYGNTASDPYITGAWTQHTWSTAIGDFMKTSQSAFSNTDGSTTFYNWTTDPGKLTCADMVSYAIDSFDGTYGRKLFYEARGYTVTDCYNQKTDNNSGGFTYANFKSEIDAGRPVFLNLAGHSIVGVGYSTTSNTIYIHDTWHSAGDQTMTWGGSYSGMSLLSVSVVNLKSNTIPTPLTPKGTILDKTPTYTWTKVVGATRYMFQLKKGATIVYTKTVTAGACSGSTCSNTPTTNLTSAAYRWHVKAYKGGLWKDYSEYKNFTVVEAGTGFNSTFNGSKAGWSNVTGTWNIYSDMYLRSTGLASTGASTVHTGNYENFTYTVRMKRSGTSTGNSNRIIIRGDSSSLIGSNWWKPSYVFQYTNNGSFSVYEETSDGTQIALNPWTSSAAIVKNGWNTLKVVVLGSSLKFYINNTLVWCGSDSSLAIGQVGFGFYRDTATGTLVADWATLNISTSDPNLSEEVAPGVELSGGTIDQSP